MAKWYGVIGFVETRETKPGVWRPEIAERNYFGELLQNVRDLQSSSNLNDNLNVANKVSVVADPFAYDNFRSIRYVEFMSTNWKVSKAEVKYPRLILTIGGVYNGEQA